MANTCTVGALRQELWSKDLLDDVVHHVRTFQGLSAYYKQEKRKLMKKKFWILWSPESHLPPTKRFDTKAEATKIAKHMAEKHPDQTFYVCQAQSVSSVRPIAATTYGLR
jgi:hypothetical protein